MVHRGLVGLGLKELKLSPGTFVLHLNGKLCGVMAIHVDDLRMACAPNAWAITEKNRTVFHFGEWKDATKETVKFCGRWETPVPDHAQDHGDDGWLGPEAQVSRMRPSLMQRRSGWHQWEAS